MEVVSLWFSLKKFFPIAIASLVIVLSLIGSAFTAITTGDMMSFVKDLSTTVTSLDYKVYQELNNFKESPNFFSLFYMLSSLFIFYSIFVKGLSKLQEMILGEGTPVVSRIFISLFILAILELASVRLINGEWFVPFTGFFMFILYIPDMLITLKNMVLTNTSLKWQLFLNNTLTVKL